MVKRVGVSLALCNPGTRLCYMKDTTVSHFSLPESSSWLSPGDFCFTKTVSSLRLHTAFPNRPG
jgi:hypothetical protein